MNNLRRLFSAVLVLGSLCVLPGTARAETYNTCAGFIDSLPAIISTQGVWCLRKDLATSMVSGTAIRISTNNVTIDCNDFKIGGLAAGNASITNGIAANNRQNLTVRHCAIRGFNTGIDFNGGAGHLIEDNRLDNNLTNGILIDGDNNRVRRNAVYDTGGFPGSTRSTGITASADVIDNTVAGVFATGANSIVHGIDLTNTGFGGGSGNEARGNQVRGLVTSGNLGQAIGIFVLSPGATLADNRISAVAATEGVGILGGVVGTFCTGNTVINFATAYDSCERSIDNLSVP